MRRRSHTDRVHYLVAIAGIAASQWVSLACHATNLRVAVVDPTDKPVADIVIVATISGRNVAASASRIAPQPAIMDQVDKLFVPEILVVRAGTPVLFPNSDSIAHQVYSFSPAKRFALPLYRGQPYPPVMFDRAGIVTLGCNIHDRMVGYVFVTDSPYFGKTDAQGRVELQTLPAATYRISVWSPRLAEPMNDQETTVADAQNATLTIKLARALRAASKPIVDPRVRDY